MNQMQMGQGPSPEKRGKRYRLREISELTGWLLGFVPRRRALLTGILSLCVAMSLANLAIPMMVGRAIDSLMDPRRLLISLGVLAAAYAVTALCGHFQGVLVSRLAQRAGYELRSALFQKLMRLPVSFTDTQSQGDIMSRLTNDIDAIVQTLSVVIPGLLSAVITIVGCVVIMWGQSVLLTVVNLCIGLAMVLLGSLYSRLMYSCVHRQQKSLGQLNAVVTEAMTQRRDIYAYQKQDQINREMTAASDDMEKAGIRAQLIGGGMEPLMGVLGNASFLVTAVCGGLLVLEGQLTIGMIQACLLYARQLLKPLTEMGMLLSQVQGGLACTDRIRFLDRTPPEEDTGTAELTRASMKGQICFDHLTFSYIRGKPVLHDLSLTVAPGETVAIVGATGIGKTTLMNLLLRFYEPDEGTIRIDGTDIRQLSRRRLYGSLGVILQSGALRTGTVADNIAWGRPGATRQEIEQAARLVRADSFIQQLPQQYDTVLSPGETVLSAGQRQLICLARIPLMDPKILILDEATSSVDAHTEMLVQQALRKVQEGRTCLLIAHRLNTIRDIPRIVVLDAGGIVEEGSHAQLMRKRGAYYRLYTSAWSAAPTEE